MRCQALLCFAFVVAVLGLSGCKSYGSSSGGGGGIVVTISPMNVNVPVNQTAQFNASVSGSSNTKVTWQVNSVTGGNSTVGTINTSGLYTAPSTVPSPAQVTVTALAQADNKTSETAMVTVIPAALLTVSPAAISLPAGSSQPFKASIEGQPTTQVTWQVNGVTGGDSVHGMITSQGVYTAPLTPPPTGMVTITALAQNNPATSGSATVTITFSNASLQGSYAFAYTGTDSNGFFTVAGSFRADGNGKLTSGEEDVSNFHTISTAVPFTAGTYLVGPDGRGTAQIQTSLGTTALRFALISNLHAFVIQFATGATASGTIDAQDPTAFSQTAIAGNYALNLSGADLVLGTPVTFGGAISASGGGLFTSGAGDFNDGGIVSPNLPISGSYTGVDAFGRGEATISSSLGTFTFGFYVVNSGDLKFMGLDSNPVMSGEVLAQPSGSISNATLSGSYVFTLGGSSRTGPIVAGGVFVADGNGNFQVGSVEDLNDAGSTTNTLGMQLTGSYTIASDGRGTASFNTAAGSIQFALYPARTGANGVASSAGLVEIASTGIVIVASGSASLQQSTPIIPATIQLSYALSFDGANSGTSLGGEEDALAQLTSDAAGNFKTGLLDINNNGTLSSGLAATGSYSLISNGRGTATIQTPGLTRHLIIYVANGSSILFIGTDSVEVIVGQLGTQF